MFQTLDAVKGSFRDPAGQVYRAGGRIFRTVASAGAAEFRAARDSGVLNRLVQSAKLVGFDEIDPTAIGLDASYVLEHPPLPFISMPYEWSFSLLKEAALFHLDLHLEL